MIAGRERRIRSREHRQHVDLTRVPLQQARSAHRYQVVVFDFVPLMIA
jgi:hypothetical protein